MPELPWVAWYPQLWLSESGLSLCSAATRGVWADVLNHMLVSAVSTIEGNKHQLAALCRCRPQEIEVAAIELDKYKVAIVRWQGDGISLTSRRVRRDLKLKDDKRKAGVKGAAKRWHPNSMGGMAASICTSSSSSGNGEYEGKGKPEAKAITDARVIIHYLNEQAGRCYRETENNFKLICGRLEDANGDVEGVKRMIVRQCKRWKGDPTMDEFLRVTTLFNKTKFEEYYANRDLPVEPAGKKPSQGGLPLEQAI